MRVAWHYLGTPYVWGGDDPSGFDCSGLVIEILQSVGVYPRGRDDTADMLRQRYLPVVDPRPGDLAFWYSGDRAIHVGIVIDPPTHYIGAEGGGRTVLGHTDAWKANAYVQVRPLSSRGARRTYANPYGDL